MNYTFGYETEEAVGQISHALLKTEFPAPLSQIETTLSSSGHWEGELEQRAKDGARVIVASQWVLYRDAKRNPVRILEVNNDVTARKHAEALQMRSQKLESLGTLTGGIAHDFNNILLAITGNVKFAIADLSPDHPVQHALAEISKAGARATDLVRRILTFSRNQETKREVLNLQPVIEEALRLVRATLPPPSNFARTLLPTCPPRSPIPIRYIRSSLILPPTPRTPSGLVAAGLNSALATCASMKRCPSCPQKFFLAVTSASTLPQRLRHG